MSLVIVYALAVAEGLLPVVGAPGFPVLARQIPRLVVSRMNRGCRDEGSGNGRQEGAEADRGIRFFPLLGARDGNRQYFSIAEMMPPARLLELHAQPEDVEFLVDGRVQAGSVTLRIHEAAGLRRVFEEKLPFDPLDPFPLVLRIMFELSGVLGWTGGLPELPDMQQPALSYYLVAKDDLLSLEAGIGREDPGEDWLKAITTLFARRFDCLEVQDLLLGICRRLFAAGSCQREVAHLLAQAAPKIDDPRLLGEAAMQLEALDCLHEANAAYDRLVTLAPTSASLSVQLGANLFQRGRHGEACDYLDRANSLGIRDVKMLAQFAVLCERTGRRDRWRELIDELAARRDLPPSIGRMVVGALISQDRIDGALVVVEDCLERHPRSAALWLEKARAHLHGPTPEMARDALDAVRRYGSSGEVQAEVARLSRFLDAPSILPALRDLDRALATGELGAALRLARGLTGEQPQLAEAWLFLGIVRSRLEQPRRAIRALRRAVETDPDLGEARNRLGILLVGRGQYQEGYVELERAMDLLPAESGPRIHMAQACFFLGRRQDGDEALREAVRLGASPAMVEAVRQAFASG